MNEVYTDKVIDKLRMKAKDDLDKVIGYLKKFWKEAIFIKRSLYENAAESLLRLGLEVKCIVVNKDHYDLIINTLTKALNENKFESKIPIKSDEYMDYLENSSLSISISKVYPRIVIPVLIHEIKGKKYYITIKSKSEDKDILIYGKLSEDFKNAFLIESKAYRKHKFTSLNLSLIHI